MNPQQQEGTTVKVSKVFDELVSGTAHCQTLYRNSGLNDTENRTLTNQNRRVNVRETLLVTGKQQSSSVNLYSLCSFDPHYDGR